MPDNRPAPDPSDHMAPVGPVPEEHLICLGLGSNINPQSNLPLAVQLIRQFMILEAVSTAWETPAVGNHGPDFLNAAVLIRTRLSPETLKNQIIRRIEAELGRVRTKNKNAPRSIDIDILIVDEQVIEPEIWTHAYLAVPIAELLPNFESKESGETIEAAARRLIKVTSIQPRPEVLPGPQAQS